MDRWLGSFVLCLVGAALAGAPALAHLDLLAPVSRYGGLVLKLGPCGVTGGERSDNVTVFEPAATIEVRWDEYIDHPGHFRVSFDVDGDDDFADPRCLSGCGSRDPEIELYSNEAVLLDGIADTIGGESGVEVTLPDVECENCTLQVIQVMYDKPPYVTPGDDIYYQCADLALRRGAPPTPTPECGTEACACAGDCNGDRVVRINELIGLVRIALGLDPLNGCPDADTNADGTIGIGEIVAAVQRSLRGCDGEPVFAGFDAGDVVFLAGDDLDGRDNDTPGSAAAQQYIIDQIRDFAVGLNTAAAGDDAYRQRFPQGTNIVAVIPGADLADEAVMLGAHYDHLGGCPGVCNGATDNASGVAAVLAVARGIVALPAPPRRSVVLAFWDREEDGLRGSKHYVDNPLVPIDETVAYLNFDIQGANLLPSLRDFSFAVGAETGGDRLAAAVDEAVSAVGLRTLRVSAIFGQGRSDYVHFVNARVPTVFFSDSTGPCYHTADDAIDVVDLDKLALQSEIGFELTRALADTDDLPQFTAAPAVVFEDAERLLEVFAAAVASDLDLFSPADGAVLEQFHSDLAAIVAAGPSAFDGAAIGTFLTGVVTAIDLLVDLPCDGFLESRIAGASSSLESFGGVPRPGTLDCPGAGC